MSRKVLVVGSEMAGGKNIQQILGKASYEVAHRGNADDAVAGLKDELPDLAIVNADISHDEGVALCRTLKATEHGKKTPILLISELDKAALHEIPEFDPNGYDQCLARSVTEDRLVGICAYWLHPEPAKAAAEDPLDVDHSSDHILDGGEVLDALDQLESIILESEAAEKKNGASEPEPEPEPVETEVAVEAMPDSLNESLAELAHLETEISSIPPIEATTSKADTQAPSNQHAAPMTGSPTKEEVTISMDDLCDAEEAPEQAAKPGDEAEQPVEDAPKSSSDGGQDIEAHLDSLFTDDEAPVLLDSGSRPIELHDSAPAPKELEQTKLIDIEAGATREYTADDPEAYAAGFPEIPNEPIEEPLAEPVVAAFEPETPTRQSERVINDSERMTKPLPVTPIPAVEKSSRTWLWIAAGIMTLGIAGWFMLGGTGDPNPEPVAETPRSFTQTPSRLPTPAEPTPEPGEAMPEGSETVELSDSVVETLESTPPVETVPTPVVATRPEPKPVAAVPVQRPEPVPTPVPTPAEPEPVEAPPTVAVQEPQLADPVETAFEAPAEAVDTAANDAPPIADEPIIDPVPAEVPADPVDVPEVVETAVENATLLDDPVETPEPAVPTPAPEPVVEAPAAQIGFVAPTVLKRVEPQVPAGARKKSGTVILRVQVTETGKIAKVVVEQGIKGAAEFESAAIYAVLNWKYEPATENGVPVSTWVNESFEFGK